MKIDDMLKNGYLFYQNTRGKLFFRGDTRPPSLIFLEGFRSRSSTYDDFVVMLDWLLEAYLRTLMDETLEKKAHLLKLKKEIDLLLEQLKQAILGTVLKDNVLDSAEPETKDFLIQFLRDKIVHTFYTLDKNTDKKPSDFNEFVNIIKHRIMEPYYTFDEHAGMDPANSISVTPHVDVTSFFPQDNTTTSYIYFVKSETAFSPHEHQKKAKPSHLFAEEHAIKDIPPGDVIAAVKISRYFIDEANGRYHNSHYHLDGDILWNPLLNGQKSPELEMFREKITYIVEIRKGKYIKIPAKGNQTPLDITQFETITESAHKEIDRYNQLYMLIKNFVFYRVADKEAYTKKIIEIAGQLDDARATMPGTNKTLLEYVKFYGRFIEEPEVNPYYDEVVKAIEELVSKAYRNQNK